MAELSNEDILAKIKELPTLPAIVFELNQVINDPLSAAADVEKVMLNDQALTAKVLKLVNSAYYAVPGGVSNLKKAIVFLGFDTIQQLVLTASVLDTVDSSGNSAGLELSQFWLHSMGVAMASETIAKHLKHKAPADLFTAGLLHDLGKIVLHMVCPAYLKQTIDFAMEKEVNFDTSEREQQLPRHTELGKLLVEQWKLPRQIQVCSLYHHELEPSSREDVSADMNETIDIVILGNLLTHALKVGESGHKKVLGAPKPLLTRLNISPESVKDIAKEIKKSLENAEAFLKIISGEA